MREVNCGECPSDVLLAHDQKEAHPCWRAPGAVRCAVCPSGGRGQCLSDAQLGARSIRSRRRVDTLPTVRRGKSQPLLLSVGRPIRPEYGATGACRTSRGGADSDRCSPVSCPKPLNRHPSALRNLSGWRWSVPCKHGLNSALLYTNIYVNQGISTAGSESRHCSYFVHAAGGGGLCLPGADEPGRKCACPYDKRSARRDVRLCKNRHRQS